MDYGKLLADALVASEIYSGNAYIRDDPNNACFDGGFNLHVAAAAFLAKVQEVERQKPPMMEIPAEGWKPSYP